MADTDVKTPETPPVQVVTADTATLREDLARMQGQLSVLAAAAADPKVEDETIDVVTDGKAALDKHFDRRAGAILAQQAEIGSATQKKLVAIERGEDWKEFGSAVEAMIHKNGIPAATLAQPGTYEKLLDMVRAENLEKIVSKRVADADAKRQRDAEEAARAAALSGPAGSTGATTSTGTKFSDKQKEIFGKMGLNDDKIAEMSKASITDDGIWVRGNV